MYKIIFTVLLSIICFSNLNAEIIKKIDISGNIRVSNETIKIYGDIKLNSDYNEQKLNTIINNLYSTNFFEDVKIELSNNVLKIYLVEYPVINNLESIFWENQKKLLKNKLEK